VNDDSSSHVKSGEPGPFAAAGLTYLQRGWGVIPLPVKAKAPPPEGWTGYGAPYASGADVTEWANNGKGDGNIGLRLRDVLAIDVDNYGDKAGGDVFDAAVSRLGPLPDTWIATSREDGKSGIRFYRVPDATEHRWADVVGPGVELLHHGHRYAVAAPSLHPEDRRYVWIGPDGARGVPGPAVDELPFMPDAWVADLDRGPVSDVSPKADMASDETTAFLTGLPVGPPCPYLLKVLDSAVSRLSSAGSRHDETRNLSLAIIRGGEQGHVGAVSALDTLESLFKGAFRPGDREVMPSEWHRMIAGAVAICVAAPTAPENRGCCGSSRVTPSLPSRDEDAFWDSRPELSHLHAFARSRMVSPWAVLGVTLCRVVAAAPLPLVLPKTVGTYGSLNLFVALVGASGGGKGTAEAAAEEALVFASPPAKGNVGSGEGIAHLYAKRTKAGVERIADAVVLSVAEIDTLGALGARQGATLLPELRKAWSGEALGFSYADPSKRLPIARGSYRMGLIAGVQPTKAGTLLDDADGGTPQRFVWLPTVDPGAPDVPPDDPGSRFWDPPLVVKDPGHGGKHVITLCDEARDEVVVTRRASLRGEETRLDGHLLYTRLKVAAALALLAGRTDVDHEDWELSGVVMDLSIATRDRVQATLSAAEGGKAEARAKMRAREAVVVAEKLESAAVTRIAKALTRRMTTDKWQTLRDVKHIVSSPDRGHVLEALEKLMEAGVVERKITADKTTFRLAE
jgi:hypothetical protein